MEVIKVDKKVLVNPTNTISNESTTQLSDNHVQIQMPTESPAVLGPISEGYDRDEEVSLNYNQSDEEDIHEEIPITRTPTMITRGSVGTVKPNPKYALTVTPTEIATPKSVKYAISIPEWKKAMTCEFKALQENNTWSLVPKRTEDNIINTKWVFKVKTNENGSIERLKARLVPYCFRCPGFGHWPQQCRK